MFVRIYIRSRFFSKYFSGADVVLLPDNDEAGEKLTTRIISDLIGVVNSIKVVKTSERNHGDVTDYFQDGYTIEDFNKLVRKAEKGNTAMDQGQDRRAKARS